MSVEVLWVLVIWLLFYRSLKNVRELPTVKKINLHESSIWALAVVSLGFKILIAWGLVHLYKLLF